MERLVNIRLYGKLGARFGRLHRMAVATPAEAIKALCVMVDGFQEYLTNAKNEGMVFSVFRGRKNIAEGDLTIGGDQDIRIAPIVEGAKKAGLFQVILGVSLVAAAAFLPGISIAASDVIFQIGAATTLGGVIQLLSPQTNGLVSRQDADNKPSYAFGGAVNSTAMGNPIAVLYGQREIGGNVISAGILAEDV